MSGKHSQFMRNMHYSLRYRLMTAFIVCILPIALVSCILFLMILNRSEQEILASKQDRFDDTMSYWEQNSRSIDQSMEFFVSKYISQLNYDHLEWSEFDRYHMFSELERVLPDASHNGITALHDVQSGIVLAQMRSNEHDALLIDTQVQAFSDRIRQGVNMPDGSWIEINGRHYLLKRYDYRNGCVFFALDVSNSIQERVVSFCEDNSTIYISNGNQVLLLRDGVLSNADLTWEECTSQTAFRTPLIWQAHSLPIGVCVVNDVDYLSLIPGETWILLLVLLFCLVNAFHLPRLIRLEVLDPAKKLRNAMQQIQSDHLDYRLRDTYYRNSEDMQYLFDTFDEMADEVEASREKDRKMYQTELDNLRLQINPHMLLNSLNTIYSLAQMQKYEAIQKYALLLVDFFRYVLRRNDDMVMVEQELEFVKTYMEIQKMRYPNALAFVYSIDESCEKALVPPLLIQSFIENSVKYAVTPGKITEIHLKVGSREDRLKISVTDTGSGMKQEILEQLRSGEPYVDAVGHKHIGIWNCRRRMEVFYNEEPHIEIASSHNGTQVTLEVPCRMEEPK